MNQNLDRENRLDLRVRQLEGELRKARTEIDDYARRLAETELLVIILEGECDECPNGEWHDAYPYRGGNDD